MTLQTRQEDLVFFGAVNASISHEIKNRMAIINEQAGLLEDLVHMAERGRPIEPERLLRLSGKVQDQVARADVIIRNMNRFAHSVDNFSHRVDLNEVLELAAALCRRKADMQGAFLAVSETTAPVTVNTSPFFLIELLWICLDRLLPGSSGATAALECRLVPEGAVVSIAGEFAAERFEAAASDSNVGQLAGLLGARVSADSQASRLVFELPANPEADQS